MCADALCAVLRRRATRWRWSRVPRRAARPPRCTRRVWAKKARRHGRRGRERGSKPSRVAFLRCAGACEGGRGGGHERCGAAERQLCAGAPVPARRPCGGRQRTSALMPLTLCDTPQGRYRCPGVGRGAQRRARALPRARRGAARRGGQPLQFSADALATCALSAQATRRTRRFATRGRRAPRRWAWRRAPRPPPRCRRTQGCPGGASLVSRACAALTWAVPDVLCALPAAWA